MLIFSLHSIKKLASGPHCGMFKCEKSNLIGPFGAMVGLVTY